jgi:hypothetical protein
VAASIKHNLAFRDEGLALGKAKAGQDCAGGSQGGAEEPASGETERHF